VLWPRRARTEAKLRRTALEARRAHHLGVRRAAARGLGDDLGRCDLAEEVEVAVHLRRVYRLLPARARKACQKACQKACRARGTAYGLGSAVCSTCAMCSVLLLLVDSQCSDAILGVGGKHPQPHVDDGRLSRLVGPS